MPEGRAAPAEPKVLLHGLIILATHSTNYRRMQRIRGEPSLIFAVMPAAVAAKVGAAAPPSWTSAEQFARIKIGP